MALAPLVEDYLNRHDAKYDVVAHPRSTHSKETAELADIPGERLVKSVVLRDEDDAVLLAVLPSTLSVHIGHLSEQTHRRLRLADEDDLQGVFPDCSPGAIPPLGPAYGVRTILDDSLDAHADLWFEAGDHEHLVHMSCGQFMALVGPAQKVHFGVRTLRQGHPTRPPGPG
ncbi:MAG TPA: YbaK/EbsC family protein [Gemmatimonadales bacterium]|nr:YbaK/EbsC family protein [Gemmatimonadales bacterium]